MFVRLPRGSAFFDKFIVGLPAAFPFLALDCTFPLAFAVFPRCELAPMPVLLLVVDSLPDFALLLVLCCCSSFLGGFGPDLVLVWPLLPFDACGFGPLLPFVGLLSF